MKPMTDTISFLFLFVITSFTLLAPSKTETNSQTKNTTIMKTYLIEREIPGAGKLSPEQLKAISQKSCSVLTELGPQIQWEHSYVTGNKIFCIYKAANEELIKEHANKGGFPANNIIEISSVISPATAN